MKILAIIINIFLPGIGTLLVKKWIQAICQIIICSVGGILTFTGFFAMIGIPIGIIGWLWAIISAVTSKPTE